MFGRSGIEIVDRHIGYHGLAEMIHSQLENRDGVMSHIHLISTLVLLLGLVLAIRLGMNMRGERYMD